jgi:O-antigen/teichoic acid export membrane protein
MTGEMAIGAFGVSVLLSVILRMLYNTWEIPNKIKPWIAVVIGILLAVVVMFYNLTPQATVGFKAWVDHILGGFMTGATAVGMYEMTKKT